MKKKRIVFIMFLILLFVFSAFYVFTSLAGDEHGWSDFVETK